MFVVPLVTTELTFCLIGSCVTISIVGTEMVVLLVILIGMSISVTFVVKSILPFINNNSLLLLLFIVTILLPKSL